MLCPYGEPSRAVLPVGARHAVPVFCFWLLCSSGLPPAGRSSDLRPLHSTLPHSAPHGKTLTSKDVTYIFIRAKIFCRAQHVVPLRRTLSRGFALRGTACRPNYHFLRGTLLVRE